MKDTELINFGMFSFARSPRGRSPRGTSPRCRSPRGTFLIEFFTLNIISLKQKRNEPHEKLSFL